MGSLTWLAMRASRIPQAALSQVGVSGRSWGWGGVSPGGGATGGGATGGGATGESGVGALAGWVLAAGVVWGFSDMAMAICGKGFVGALVSPAGSAII